MGFEGLTLNQETGEIIDTLETVKQTEDIEATTEFEKAILSSNNPLSYFLRTLSSEELDKIEIKVFTENNLSFNKISQIQDPDTTNILEPLIRTLISTPNGQEEEYVTQKIVRIFKSAH